MTDPSISGYSILEKIGEGGFGLVYKAKQTNTGQLVAIKVLKNTQTVDEQKIVHQKARFERETQLSAQLSHPHIVKLLDKGYTETGEPFAVFEYIAGQTLKDYVIREGGLSATETGELMGQVLDALASAHEQGIVHRDLKPQNLMVTKTGTRNHIKILDFGIGAFTQEYRTKDYKSLTLTKEMVGTPSYSAPEQLRGEPPTVKSDIYAWGLILIECLTGRTVMEGDSIAEIFQQQLQAANVPIPSAIVGHPLANLLRRVLEKNPLQRSGDAPNLYEEYKTINFNTIVGKIAQAPTEQIIDDDATVDSDMDVVVGRSAKRQITILAVKLSLVLPDDYQASNELLDTIQKDQLNTCTDIAVRFGGHIAGNLADNLMFYFGYPTVSDNDARRAGRTALELVSQTQKRSSLLEALHGIGLDIRVSLHSGSVLVKQGITPEGITPNIAFNLLYQSSPNAVLVSETAKQLLDPFLEFEVAKSQRFPNATKEMKLFSLVGERQTEALSFLRPWSANRQMIGRDTEHQQFVDLWNGVSSANGKAMLLNGQAGIGKSKLTYECKKQVRDRDEGVEVVECRCLPEYENNALYPFFEMLRKHWGLQEGEKQEFNIKRLEEVLKEAACEVEMALPILCSWLSIPLSDTYEAVALPAPEQQKRILLDTLEKLILNIDASNKFLLIIEDLHWLDPTSKEFLEQLLNNLSQQNYMILMTTRPQFKPDWTYNNLTTLDLKPLTNQAIKAMIEGVLENKQVDDSIVSYIAQRADGVPLFIEELTHMLLEQNYLIADNDTYKLSDKINQDTVPVTLQDLLNARLDKLGLAKETAQLAAAIGRNFDYNLLVRSSLRDEASIQADLDKLMNADLVYRQRKVQGESYIFRHALIRDAAYDGMPTALQKDTHGRIATTLENEFPQIKEDNPFEVARHYAGGENFEKATGYGLSAMQKQIASSANLEALSLSKEVEKWTDTIVVNSVKTKKKLELNNYLLSALMALDGFGAKSVAKVKDEIDKIIKESEEYQTELMTSENTAQVNDNKLLINVIKEKIAFFENSFEDFELSKLESTLTDPKFKNDWVELLGFHLTAKRKQANEASIKVLEQANELQLVAILPMISQVLFIEGYLEDSAITGRSELELLESLEAKIGGDVFRNLMAKIAAEYGMEPRSATNFLLSQTVCYQGFPDDAFDYIDKALKWAESIEHTLSVTLTYIFKVFLFYILQNREEAKNTVEIHDEKYGHITENNWVTTHLKCHYDWSINSVEYATQYVKDTLASEQHYALSPYEASLADTYLFLNQHDEAVQLLEDSLKRGSKHQELGNLPLVERRLALSYYKKDQSLTNRVTKHLKNAIQIAKGTGAKWLEFEGLVDYVELLQQHNTNGEELVINIGKLKEKFEFFQDSGQGINTQIMQKAKNILDVVNI